MNFAEIKGKLNTQETKQLVDSILNVGDRAIFVIDRGTFEVLYLNEKASELFGDKVDAYCYELICDNENACIDCPMAQITDKTIVRNRHSRALDAIGKWQYSVIRWFDNREAVLVTLLDVAVVFGDKEDSQIGRKERIAREGQFDALTGIPNYSKFCANTENAIRYNPDKEYAIITFDIDKFKSVNDLYGMSVGDMILKHIANALRGYFPYDENYARLHSDVFAFFMSYTKRGEIIRAIEKIRRAIVASDIRVDISTTFGIYLVKDRHVPINLMCDRAKMAAATIKNNVMKFCAFYDEQYRDDMIKVSEIEREMKRALHNHEFKMYLQPKYSLKDNSMCGAEVLSRWMHPEKGLIPPMDFIPLFERNGFIMKLDEYMWEQACKTIRGWIDAGIKPIPLSVNISRYHIQHNDLPSIFNRLLKQYKLSSDMLTLEITESMFMNSPAKLADVLNTLRERGFKLEVDDFGAGFSSLSLIRDISVDTIKIDKNFLDQEIASDKGKIVVSHTISMAKDLNLQVVAEGVETGEHVEFLKNSNCDIAQGYYFARPMPVEEFNQMVAKKI
ncbi:MAG: bifunctional diguanylate cyclase/phosphodiesterase [Lachnospiraceae bacterium]|nr:bifunctional diguanylate cyclase/phosphodiesterase [Lachnospiraceae bacterium]